MPLQGLLQVRPRALAAGLASFVPGLRRFTNRASGGTDVARYCYSVWLRHLVRAHEAGLPTTSGCVAELGPGDSLGIGLAAVLCGADRYIALDVKAHANPDRNLRIFDELVGLFRARAPIPDNAEFPAVQPPLSSYAFPEHILTPDRLKASLAEPRLEQIRSAILGERAQISIAYKAPWNDPSIIEAGCVDFLLSQAVLEHVEDLDVTYRAMRTWMKPAAAMSHAIDFSCHEITRTWNGHWTLGGAVWRAVRGTRGYLINRQPWSVHRKLLSKYGFKTVHVENHRGDVAGSFRPAGPFKSLSADDVSTRGVFVQAKAPAGS
jgi:hypothetical protein